MTFSSPASDAPTPLPELPRPWLSHYEPGVPRDFRPSDLTLPELLDRTAARIPGRAAMTFLGAQTSYAALQRDARRLALALQKMGVKKGDRVAIMLPNCPQFVTAFYGALIAGAVVVGRALGLMLDSV